MTDIFWNYTHSESKGALPKLDAFSSSGDLRLIVEGGGLTLQEQLYPLFARAASTFNPNVTRIVAFKNETVDKYNKALHFAFYPDARATNDVNPRVGEMITYYDNYYQSRKLVASNGEDGIVINRGNIITDEHGVKYFTAITKSTDGSIANVLALETSTENRSKFKQVCDEWAERLNKEKEAGGRPNWPAFYAYKERYADMRLGYATTIHKSQGSTYEVVGVDPLDSFGNKKFQSQGFYTAATRASNIIIIKFRSITMRINS